MKIFLDVGAHNGWTLEEVVEPRWSFDVIHSFEPMPREFNAINAKYGQLPNVELHNYGLSDETGARPVYGSNDRCEASVYPSKVDVDPSVISMCRFVEATEFFATLPDEAEVIVKMNCEGSEVAILNNLMDSGEIWRITAMTFDLDIRNVRGQEDQADALLARMAEFGFDRYRISGEHFHGDTHRAKIANWLSATGIGRGTLGAHHSKHEDRSRDAVHVDRPDDRTRGPNRGLSPPTQKIVTRLQHGEQEEEEDKDQGENLDRVQERTPPLGQRERTHGVRRDVDGQDRKPAKPDIAPTVEGLSQPVPADRFAFSRTHEGDESRPGTEKYDCQAHVHSHHDYPQSLRSAISLCDNGHLEGDIPGGVEL